MKRSAGILLHLSSLPSPYGIGTLGKAAYEFTDFLKAAGQTYWQMLPIGPTGYGDSPYQSSTSFGGNPYFVDLGILEQEGLLTREELCLSRWGGDPQRVDYGLLYQNRGVLLRRAYDRWGSREEAEYRSFLEENGSWLVDYAEFAALKERFGGLSWLEWPETYRSPETIPEKVRESLEEEVNYHCFVQFLFFRQWNALRRYANGEGVYLIGDLPFYSALDSADVWANPEQFQLDERRNPTAVAGVPPDCFSKNGQLWGNPLYDWDFMRQDGYSWWIRRMRRGAALFDLVRLDHFCGLESYWAVPFGETDGSAGRWEKGPAMELIRRFREEVPEAKIIAEDLGILTPQAKWFTRQTGYPGMKVLQFAFDGHKENPYLPENCPENSVVYTGTHDNDTLAGWLSRMNREEREQVRDALGVKGAGGLHRIILECGTRCRGELFLVPMQDYLNLGSKARMNVPGTAQGNWVWRMKPGVLTEGLAKQIREYAELGKRI